MHFKLTKRASKFLNPRLNQTRRGEFQLLATLRFLHDFLTLEEQVESVLSNQVGHSVYCVLDLGSYRHIL